MAKASAMTTLQANIDKLMNFVGYLFIFVKKKNPIKACINDTINYLQELFSLKQKLKKIEYRINYERYKLKKTELILAQNSEHVFLQGGRKLNQTR